ncbi:hypothetical protein PGTUg99_011226 [Puccinia graminis f. sp. tritici]|uniref:Uncharacterized protein n=1 Tax=Puccinia graminis f. sp. tritici TaxID=56615 RepID=A0A5B0QQK9_PUCGR|nr:hypothetical protein PGTUg99_011226 [Puccinia graminis f. sp. tritici]
MAEGEPLILMRLRLWQERERGDLDEGKLLAENKKLKEDVKELEHSKQKLLQVEQVLQNQLSYSEDKRYKLEAKVAEATDECCVEAKLLRKTSEELRLARLKLDSMDSRVYLPHEVQKSATQDEKKSQEIEYAKCAKEISNTAKMIVSDC